MRATDCRDPLPVHRPPIPGFVPLCAGVSSRAPVLTVDITGLRVRLPDRPAASLRPTPMGPAGAVAPPTVLCSAPDGAAPRGAAMLSREDNERLTRTGPGTPMGTFFRRFWVP